jgi:hypothetical protein
VLQLEGPLPAWDVVTTRADVGPFVAWLLDALRAKGVALEALSALHRQADASRALELSQHLSFASSVGAGRRLVHELVRATLPRLPWRELAVQTVPHVRILVPGDALAPVPPHTDHDIGHGLFERNLWFALTDARHILPPSLSLPRREAALGDVLLFTPLHAHAAQVVTGDATRVSMDLRLAPLQAVRQRGLRTFVPLEKAS